MESPLILWVERENFVWMLYSPAGTDRASLLAVRVKLVESPDSRLHPPRKGPTVTQSNLTVDPVLDDGTWLGSTPRANISRCPVVDTIPRTALDMSVLREESEPEDRTEWDL